MKSDARNALFYERKTTIKNFVSNEFTFNTLLISLLIIVVMKGVVVRTVQHYQVIFFK